MTATAVLLLVRLVPTSCLSNSTLCYWHYFVCVSIWLIPPLKCKNRNVDYGGSFSWTSKNPQKSCFISQTMPGFSTLDTKFCMHYLHRPQLEINPNVWAYVQSWKKCWNSFLATICVFLLGNWNRTLICMLFPGTWWVNLSIGSNYCFLTGQSLINFVNSLKKNKQTNKQTNKQKKSP